MFQDLRPQLFLTAPMRPAPLLIFDAYIYHIVEMFTDATSPRPPIPGSLPPTLLQVSPLCLRWSPRSSSATHGAFLHLCIVLYQGLSRALCSSVALPMTDCNSIDHRRPIIPLQTRSSLICRVLSGLPTNGLLSACNTSDMFFSFYNNYLDNSLSRHITTNGNSVVPPTYFSLCY